MVSSGPSAVATRERRRAPLLAVREVGPAGPPTPRLLDRVRDAIRARHYSQRTEKAYAHWIKRYIFFHGKRHPAEMGAPEVTRFLTSRAADGRVAASTQNQALSALLFLYREVLAVDLPWLDDIVRAKRPGTSPGTWRLSAHHPAGTAQRNWLVHSASSHLAKSVFADGSDPLPGSNYRIHPTAFGRG